MPGAEFGPRASRYKWFSGPSAARGPTSLMRSSREKKRRPRNETNASSHDGQNNFKTTPLIRPIGEKGMGGGSILTPEVEASKKGKRSKKALRYWHSSDRPGTHVQDSSASPDQRSTNRATTRAIIHQARARTSISPPERGWGGRGDARGAVHK